MNQPSGLQFKSLFESAPNAMIMVDQQGSIILSNQQTESIFKYAKNELIGKPIEILIPKSLHSKHREYREDYNKNSSSRSMGAGRDLKGVAKDGVEIPLEIGLNPIEIDEKKYIICAIVDITERKKNEKKLKEQAEELVRINSELEQFAYVASHDLQAPLRHITSYVQLLERDLKNTLSPKNLQWMNFVTQGAKRMQNLINGLLDFSRTAREGLKIEFVSLEKILADVLKNLDISIKESDAQVITSSLPTIYCDPSQITRLLQNLIENAIKFRRKNYKLVIEVFCEDFETEWRFAIKDNGIGIESEYLEEIFVIFKRLHSHDEYPGTGIGLTICKKIVDEHGGKINVISNPSEGSTFYFTLNKNLLEKGRSHDF